MSAERANLITDEELAKLRATADRATPGPWYTCGLPWFRTGSGVMAANPDPHAGYMIADTEAWEGEREEYLDNDAHVQLASPDEDAEYIATFDPPTVKRLLDEIARLRNKQSPATAAPESPALRSRHAGGER